MSLTLDDVKRIANLARLSFTEDELVEITEQLGNVVELVTELSQVDTDGISPMVHAIEIVNVLVEDKVLASLPREEALKNAPSSDDECFRVPAVLG
ncbi:MAG: Asp-tRNA(Asn)/Glu-tRNA(Gln) amidotransferase subunit GatC [Pirellula sp.]|jgi:aspartyl-tRNA(Asn)/glutamyl-tRNA(Gln) amidotransferase subunit C|nr:Asp-tRNA(Asn)/Glu-tRNA(Gln) amidotransferase subunit GatC [Pirellula sp.]